MEEMYNNLFSTNVTVLSNDFLNKYLADTKPEYIKVFLFYYWKGIKENYTISETSSEIDLDENVVEMALKYWIKKKILKKECLTTTSKNKNTIDENNEVQVVKTKKNKKNYEDVEKGLLFVAEKLLGQTLSDRQLFLIRKCYSEYNFDESLIQYLIEFCSEKSQTNAKYMSSVAETWYEQGIKTVDDAKKFVQKFEKKNFKNVKKSSSRTLDRKDDYNKLFMEAVSNGKFK